MPERSLWRPAFLVGLASCLLCQGPSLARTADDVVAESSRGISSVWTQWRGPSRDGQVGGETWPAALEGHLRLKWRVDDLEESYSGPIVSERFVFTTESRDDQEFTYAYDRESGALVWTASWEGSMQVPFFAGKNGSWIRSTPSYDDGRLYVGGMQDVLVCLDAATGKTEWSVDLSERFKAPRPAFGLVCSPLVNGEHIYVQAGASFVKLNKEDGSTVWRSLEDEGGMMGSAFSSPILASVAGTTQLLVQAREYLAGVDPESGQRLWSQPIPTFRGMNILTPMVFEGAVFSAAYGGTTQLLTIQDDGGEAVVTQAWQNSNQGNMTSPVMIGDFAYFLNRSNRFTCVNLRNGEIAWTSPPTGDEYWSLCAQGDRILALANTGRLRMIQANPDEYRVTEEFEIAEDETWAHLAIASGELFIREQYGLAAYTWD